MLKILIQSVMLFCITFTTCCAQKPTFREITKLNVVELNNCSFRNFLGINGFEWDLLDDKNNQIDEHKLQIMRSFGGLRHYMDWERIESEKEKYTFNPTHSGNFNYDEVYRACHNNNIEVLSCLKNCTPWIIDTYPKEQKNGDISAVPYGLNRSNPQSYIFQAKAGFQFAARYGNNKNIDSTLVHVDKTKRWHGDPSNEVKIGLGYVHYIECGNEVDKTWRGPSALQSPEEYAANLSAFYDGDQGRLGNDVGVKNADPSMQIVMSGLSSPDPNFVIRMIAWCKKHRGTKSDGSTNLCFDVINYHYYNSDDIYDKDVRTVGKAPELSLAGKIADSFVNMSKNYAMNMDVWITESGYDINPGSPQRAIKIGDKSALITQADWMLRSALLYARHGLKRSFFYMLDDVITDNSTPYASSGFIDKNKRRPVADYFMQTKKLLGPYSYEQTINSDPIVDIYAVKNKKIYVLYIPDEIDRKAVYDLKLPKTSLVRISQLVPGASQMKSEILHIKKGTLRLNVTETPVFIENLN